MAGMWSDNESEIDFLGLDHLVGIVEKIILDESLSPATIGVFGDWGSGKSSLLRFVSSRFKDNEDILFISFNGWLFEGYEETKSALVNSILDQIYEKRQSQLSGCQKARELFTKLVKRINWLKVCGSGVRALGGFLAAGPAGTALTTLSDPNLQDLGKALKDLKPETLKEYMNNAPEVKVRKSVREFRKDFGELIKLAGLRSVVVVIDDLDRCLPETIIETLEAIKLLLFVKGSVFVIGADERLVRYAVSRRFPESKEHLSAVGRDYLEKLIQFPVKVPPLGSNDMVTYLCLLFTQRRDKDLLSKALEHLNNPERARSYETAEYTSRIAQKLAGELSEDLFQDLLLGERIAPLLVSNASSNPRQGKRFLNTLIMRLDMAVSLDVELKQRVLAKLMVLEYFNPDSFKRLAKEQAAEKGRPKSLSNAEKLFKNQEFEADDAEEPKVSESELPNWLKDPWVVDWLRSQPSLAEEDLRPYFYFSRDAVGALSWEAARAKPWVQSVLGDLLNRSEAVRRLGVKKAEDANLDDAMSVLEHLFNQVRTNENSEIKEFALSSAFAWVGEKKELFNKLVSLLESIPTKELPISLPQKLIGCAKTEDRNTALSLVRKWSLSKDLIGKSAERLLKLESDGNI